ncbi:MAG: hypothetical protein E6H57_06895 [Betaproteobacteria bacterium]|nr:MAG: hypothetical protein E6H57_06895 [Betaproteobacteria bacterium]
MHIALAHVPDEPDGGRFPAARVGELGIDDAQAQPSGTVELRRERELHGALPRGGILAIAEHFHAERRRAGAGEAQLPLGRVELGRLEIQVPAAAFPIDLVRPGGRGGQLCAERLPDGLEGNAQRNFKPPSQCAGGAHDEAAER